MAKGGGGKKRPASDQSEDGQGSHHEPSTKKSKVQQGSTNLKDKTIGVATRRTSDRGIRDDFLSRPDARDTRLAALISPFLESNDPELRNTRRLAKLMQDVKLGRRPAKLEIIIDNSSTVPGRRVKLANVLRNVEHRFWRFFFEDLGTVKAFRAKRPNMQISFDMLAEDTSETVIRQVQLELAKYYERFPWTTETSKVNNAFVVRTILSSRQISLLPRGIHDVSLHSRTAEGAGALCKIFISFYDRITGAMDKTQVSVRPTAYDTKHIVVPSLPDYVLIRQQGSEPGGQYVRVLRTAGEPHYKVGSGESWEGGKAPVKAQHLAQDALRYLAYTLDSLVSTKLEMAELIAFHREIIGLNGERRDANLYTLTASVSRSQTIIRPSGRVSKDLGITRTSGAIYVQSMLSNRASPVLDAILQNYCAGEELRYAFIKAAMVADSVNAAINQGSPPSSRCDCDDEQANAEFHACEGCTKATRCSERTYDSLGRLVCRTCDARGAHRASIGQQLPRDFAARYMVLRSLRLNFNLECSSRGLDRSTLISALEEAESDSRISSAVTLAQPTSYVDMYTSKTHDIGGERQLIGNNPSRRRYMPEQVCVDAVYPVGSTKYPHLKHAAGNIVATSCAVNMAKGRFLPGVLQEIADFCRDPSPQKTIHLLSAINHLTTALVKSRLITASIKPENMTPAMYSKHKLEMLSGKVAPNEHGPWEQHVQKFCDRTPSRLGNGSNAWDDATLLRLQKCAQSISEWSGVALFSLPCGTLWTYDMESITPGLNCNGLVSLCRERLRRMTLECNKKWDTDETDESLYMEIIFQHCASHTTKPELAHFKEKYGDQLGLPLTIQINSPLRLSVAHRLHGSRMVSAWDSHPTSVQQRLDNDQANNMLIESWILNSAKMDIAEERYEQLYDILRGINVPKEFYDPGAMAPSGDPNFSIDSADGLNLNDDFEGGVFNSEDMAGTEAVADTTITAPQDDQAGKVPSAEDGEEPGGAGGEEPGVEGGEEYGAQAPADKESTQAFIDYIRGEILDTPQYAIKFRKDPQVIRLLGRAQELVDGGEYEEGRDMGNTLTALLEEGRDDSE